MVQLFGLLSDSKKVVPSIPARGFMSVEMNSLSRHKLPFLIHSY